MATKPTRYTIQSGLIKNTKDYTNFGSFLNGIDVTNQALDGFTPFVPGVARIFVHKHAPFMETFDTSMCRNFRTLIETGYTRIDGIQDTSVEFTDYEGGFNGDKFSMVASARNDADSFSITVYEQTGSPVREFIDTWVTGTRDIRSGIAHYHGALAETPYSAKNHTMEFIYCVLDPTGQNVEYACMFANCFPTKVPKGHLNFESGQRDRVQMDLEFRCKQYESPAINQIAKWYLAKSRIEYDYLRFTPGTSYDMGRYQNTPRDYGNKNLFKSDNETLQKIHASSVITDVTSGEERYGETYFANTEAIKSVEI